MPLLSSDQICGFLNEDGIDETVSALPALTSSSCEFSFVSKNEEDFILCGASSLKEIMAQISLSDFIIKEFFADGSLIQKGDVILSGIANTASVLLAERTALNLIQQLSAVSTNAYKLVQALADTKIQVLDTRKTFPGLRSLQKYAVLCGGGKNHRFGLYDLILIKDNHIVSMGGIKKAIESVNLNNKKNLKVEIECETIDQVREALEGKIDIIMLDNMDVEDIKKSSAIIRSKSPSIKIEVSGGINLETIEIYKNLDIDYISSGSLTHTIKAVDVSANFQFYAKDI